MVACLGILRRFFVEAADGGVVLLWVGAIGTAGDGGVCDIGGGERLGGDLEEVALGGAV